MSKCINVKYEGKPLYNIVIEQSFDKLAEEFDKLGVTGRKLCIVSDSNVAPLYAKYVEDQLSKTGNKVFTYVFEAGEANKNLDTVEDVYEFLIKNHFDRKDMLVALGGGVVGDLTGFTAATYLRGISFIQVPTSLLAQVDSSIGGKTGVDFRAYKNMVGAFYQPKLVYMNISVLKSLSDRLFNSGFGEIIKHGLIKDAAYYKWLRDNISNIKNRNSDALEQMIYVSCNIKREVVEKDPKEKGDRALLNYGHTLGHAIEKLMNFKLYHGECVTLGMIAALRISVNRGDIDEGAYNDAIDKYKNDCKYMAFLDLDEYLFPMQPNCEIDKLLDSWIERYPGASGCGVNWCIFGSSDYKKRPSGLIIENYINRGDDKHWANYHVKTICNPRRVKYFISPHYPLYKLGAFSVTDSGYGKRQYGWFNRDVHYSTLRINHYYTKSEEDYVRKISRGLGDREGHYDLSQFNKYNLNDIKDDSMHRYWDVLKSKMGK